MISHLATGLQCRAFADAEEERTNDAPVSKRAGIESWSTQGYTLTPCVSLQEKKRKTSEAEFFELARVPTSGTPEMDCEPSPRNCEVPCAQAGEKPLVRRGLLELVDLESPQLNLCVVQIAALTR